MDNGTWVKVGRDHKLLDPPLSLRVCRTFGSRLKGFLLSSPPPPERGLLFWYSRPSRMDTAIHMLGVPFPLAVIWLDEHRIVVDKRVARPWQPAIVPERAAQYVIECHPQRFNDFVLGQRYEFLQ